MELKFVGFDKAIDTNIRTAKKFAEMFGDHPNDEADRKELINYLKKGIFLTGVMSNIYDNEKKIIGNLNYFTDGKFVWPVYYPYYLEKYNNFKIDNELYTYANEMNYQIHFISKEQLKKLE